MANIDALIAQKEAEIVKIKDDIKALRRAQAIVESVSGVPAKRPKRAPRGEKKKKVLAAMSKKSQSMSAIGKAAGVSTAEAGSVLQAGMKSGEVKKQGRGMYKLA